MKKSIRALLMVLILAAVAVGGYRIYESRFVSTAVASGTTYTQEVEVTRGALDATVSVVGQLEAEKSASLAFEQVSGTTNLLALAVQAGNVVTAGQVLATIDDASYQQAVDQATSDLQAAEETFAALQTPATSLEIARADVAIMKAKVALKQAQAALEDLTDPDIASLESAVVSGQIALAEAQANLIATGADTDYETQLARLVEAEATATDEYNRLAAETYTDAYYRDRLQLAYNEMMDAQDARASYELSHQSSILQAQITVRSAEAALPDAQEALADAQAGGDPLKLAQAQLDVNEAEVAVQAAQEAQAELDEGADASDLAAAQAAVDAKRLVLSDAEAALAGAQLAAPFSGTILETYVNAGDQVSANTSVLDLADMDTLQVVASIDETTVRQISTGQTAIITFDAFPGQSFTGEVLAVPMQGTLQGDVMVYSVPVSLAGAGDLALRVGMTANVEIQVGQTGETLLVPTIALQQSNGAYQVLVPNATDSAGDPVAVTVEVGQSDGTYTEILSGLSEGDQVLVEISTSTSDETGMMGGLGSMDMSGGMPPAQ